MTREETVKVIRLISACYPSFKPDDLSYTIDVWCMMLSNVDCAAVVLAVQRYVKRTPSKFAPSIGEILDNIKEMQAEREISEIEKTIMAITMEKRNELTKTNEVQVINGQMHN